MQQKSHKEVIKIDIKANKYPRVPATKRKKNLKACQFSSSLLLIVYHFSAHFNNQVMSPVPKMPLRLSHFKNSSALLVIQHANYHLKSGFFLHTWREEPVIKTSRQSCCLLWLLRKLQDNFNLGSTCCFLRSLIQIHSGESIVFTISKVRTRFRKIVGMPQ